MKEGPIIFTLQTKNMKIIKSNTYRDDVIAAITHYTWIRFVSLQPGKILHVLGYFR